MAYADYAYYTERYLGDAIPEGEFPALAERATEYIDFITDGRAAKRAESDSVKKAMCAVAEAWRCLQERGAVVEERVGTWSRSYAVLPEGYEEKGLMIAVKRYLAPLGFLKKVDWA